MNTLLWFHCLGKYWNLFSWMLRKFWGIDIIQWAWWTNKKKCLGGLSLHQLLLIMLILSICMTSRLCLLHLRLGGQWIIIYILLMILGEVGHNSQNVSFKNNVFALGCSMFNDSEMLIWLKFSSLSIMVRIWLEVAFTFECKWNSTYLWPHIYYILYIV